MAVTVVSCVDVAPDSAIGDATAAVANIAALAADVAAALCAIYTTPAFAVVGHSAGVNALLVLPSLSIAALRGRHRFELAAQPLHLVERRGLVRVVGPRLSQIALAHAPLRLLESLVQLRKPLRNLRFRAI